MRSPMLPRIHTSIKAEEMDARHHASTWPAPDHSRNSSTASNASTPMSPAFSLRTHSRCPSSSSSLATSPDSPINICNKSSLDDLVEEPAEIDDVAHRDSFGSPQQQEFCICDTIFCKHQQAMSGHFPTPPPSIPEWVPGDDHMDFAQPTRSLKSQRSVDMHFGKIGSRLSHRWPSISSRWRDRRPSTSVSVPTVHSAPPSRTASAKHQSLRQSLANHLEPHETMLLFAPKDKTAGNVSPTPSSPTLPQHIDFSPYGASQDPIDRQELASTPLLPPMLSEQYTQKDDSFQSPLQSPSVASPSTAATFGDAPFSGPSKTGIDTPPLSARPSIASMYRVYSNHLPRMSADGTDYNDAETPDYYTMKLGHANFHILPEPYMPERCDKDSCARLLLDWEAARREYMKQAFLISENYGPTSQTYKLTSEKWAQIDQEWQSNLNRARSEAEALGETPHHENLAQTVSVSHMPSLPFDPKNPEKFPALDEGGMVGPMVQYTRIQRTPSRKKNLLKLILEPTGLFGARSPFRTRS